MSRIFTAFCCLFLSLQAISQTDYRVRFRSGTEVFPENFGQFLAGQSPISNHQSPFVVQFFDIPTAAARAEMEGRGVQFLGYVRFGAYFVGLPGNFDFKILEKHHPRSLVAVDPKWKIDPKLRERPFPKHAEIGGQIEVNAQVWPNVSIGEAAKLCHFHGLNVVFEGNQNGFLTLRFFPDDLDRVASLPFIQWLEITPPPGEKEDTGGRSIHRSNLVDSDSPMGRKYNGLGIKVLTRDDGVVGPHIDFKGRIKNLTQATPTATHGDGVSGIMCGTGNLDPNQKGMAAGADLFVIDYVNNFQDTTLPLHQLSGVKITNSSYSDGCNVGYTLATQTVDRQLFENPGFMHVFSAGNMGEVDCSDGAGSVWGNITGGHKMAKNSIATANLFADGSLEVSSSRGPAYDGRLKPDIAAHGQNQGSTSPNNAYQVFGGTSGAAPGIAGCLAQLSQAFSTVENGQDAPMALLKAVIMNTANDMGNPGPDFKFGWGHVNAWRALRLLEEKRWLKSSVGQGGGQPFVLQIPAGVRQAKVMVYWAERQSSTQNNRALLNDLDLTVSDPAGLKNLPWLLDPTPNPSAINSNATKGRDDLNNMEQVALDNPAPGDYVVNVAGFEVPFGPQEFYVVWEFMTDEIKITYPAGGEGFVPGTSERIHWDAFGGTGDFTLRYAADGENWQNLATVPATERMFSWTVPGGKITSAAKLMLLRGASVDTIDHPFSIVGVPANLKVERVCPDSMTVSWSKITDTLAYDVYLLGQKYMEIAASTTPGSATTATFPIQNPGAENWVSVRAAHPNGLAGRRANAIRYPGGLLNCPQPFDAEMGTIIVPVGNAIVSCDAPTQTLTVTLKNDGLNTISGATISYSTNNGPATTESLPDLPVGQTLVYTFQQPVLLAAQGFLTLKVWTTFAGDLVFFNDTISKTFPVLTQPVSGNYTQNFQNATFPPLGWQVLNPDGAVTWARVAAGVTGSNGANTAATYLNCFSYSARGEEDHLVMLPMELTAQAKPALAFDVSHAQFNSGRKERLRVDVFPNCDLTAAPITVYDKSDPQLATTSNTNEQFFPDTDGDWRTEVVDLQQFKDQVVIIRFTLTNDFGNNIFLDNVRLTEFNLQLPVADFSVSLDTICRADSVLFSSLSTGNFLSHKWIFGGQASPSSASGAGPHWVTYVIPGDKNVRLIVANSIGADTITRTIKVYGQANANFSFSQNGNTVNFNNISTQAVNYFWDFGDGTSSTEKSPVHVFAAPGTFAVKLRSSSPCKTSEKTVQIVIATIGTEALENAEWLRVLPNPTPGDFEVEIRSDRTETLRLELFDAAGRLIKTTETTVGQGVAKVPFVGLDLPKGIHQLKVFSGDAVRTSQVVVQ